MGDNNENKILTPIELFGVECGKGWYKLIEPIINYIEEYNQDKKEEDKIKIIQIKEKYGGLRIYTSFDTQELHKMISEAEEKSYRVCEICGSEKYVGCRTNAWIQTICIDCINKNLNKDSYIQLHEWEDLNTKQVYLISKDNIEQVLQTVKK